MSWHLGINEGRQGWTEAQVVTSLVLLNLAGGECVEDPRSSRGQALRLLEKDLGLGRVLRLAETQGMGRRERGGVAGPVAQGAPPQCAVGLGGVPVLEPVPRRSRGGAAGGAQGVHTGAHCRTSGSGPGQRRPSGLRPKPGSAPAGDPGHGRNLIETHKEQALYCYKKHQAYQPFTTYWAEAGLVVHSEFRDGNVPAGHQQLRLLRESLERLPSGVEQVLVRSDTAGYQQEFLHYCAEGKDQRFGVIEFAVGVDVTQEFKAAVARVDEEEWRELYREVGGRRVPTGQQYAEVSFVPNWIGHSKKSPEYRFIALRERFRNPPLRAGEPVGIALHHGDGAAGVVQGLWSGEQPGPGPGGVGLVV